MMDLLYIALKGEKKIFLNHLICNKEIRKKSFMLISRNLLKKSKEFPDKLCGEMIEKEFKKVYKENKNIFLNKDIYKYMKELYQFNECLGSCNHNFKSLKYIVSLCYHAFYVDLKSDTTNFLLKKLNYVAKKKTNIRSLECAEIIQSLPITTFPEETRNNIYTMSEYKVRNFRKVYRKLFNIHDNLPEGLKKRGNEFNVEKYLDFKRKLIGNNIEMSHVDFISSLFKIKKNI